MELDTLSIYTSYSGERQGTIKFNAHQGSVEIKLTPDDCKQILAVVASRLVNEIENAAAEMRGVLIQAAQPTLPSPPSEEPL